MIALENIIPLYKVEHNAILSAQGDITIAFKVKLPEIFTLSANDYESLHQTLVKAIRVLPSHSVFTKQDWFLHQQYQPTGNVESASFLEISAELHFKNRPFLDQYSYIFLTKKPEERKLSSSAYSNILRKSIVPQQTLSPAMFEVFLDSTERFSRILSDSGFIGLERLSDEEMAGTRKKVGIIEQYCLLAGQQETSMLQDVHIKDEIRVGEHRCQLFTLADVEDLPAMCASRITYEPYSTDQTKFSTGFAASLGLLLPCDHIYSQQRLPVKAHFNVLAWTDKPEQLQEIRNLTGAAIARLDATARLETDGAPQIWFAGLPGNAADFPVNDSFDTFLEQATCFLNTDGNYQSDEGGIRFGERLSGRPVRADLFDHPMKSGLITNRNLFVCGGSGGGKSMLMNHMLRTLYEQGTHCVVIDIGGSYKGLCDLVGGYYFIYTEENPIRFNPFYLSSGEVLDTEKKESLKTLLVALWKKDDERYSRSEYVAISNSLTLYYEHLEGHPDIFPCFNSYYEFLQKNYRAVLSESRVQDREFNVEGFLYVLSPYYKGGEFDYLLNARENLDMLSERFIVFELDNVKSAHVKAA